MKPMGSYSFNLHATLQEQPTHINRCGGAFCKVLEECYDSHGLFYLLLTLYSTMTHCSHTPLHYDSLFSYFTPL